MRKNRILIALMPFFYLMMIPSFVQAATITSCTFDKDWYFPGQTGCVVVTVYNDEESMIRVFELAATIDYYYNDDNVYLQTFFSYLEPATEVQQGQSNTFYIDFSLPNNIAPGYTTLLVKAKTEIWNDGAERWQGSDHPTYRPTLHIESSYKQQFEEQQAINQTTSTMMSVLGVTTLVFAVVIGLLLIILRRARAIILAQPTA